MIWSCVGTGKVLSRFLWVNWFFKLRVSRGFLGTVTPFSIHLSLVPRKFVLRNSQCLKITQTRWINHFVSFMIQKPHQWLLAIRAINNWAGQNPPWTDKAPCAVAWRWYWTVWRLWPNTYISYTCVAYGTSHEYHYDWHTEKEMAFSSFHLLLLIRSTRTHNHWQSDRKKN